MKHILMFLFVAGLAAAQPEAFQGDWNGTLNVGATKLRVVFHLQNKDGKLTGTLDSPDQGAFGLPVNQVTVEGKTLKASMSSLGASYEGTLEGTSIDGTFAQAGAKFPLHLQPGKLAAPKRPQMPAPPFPYDAEDVTIQNGAVTLAGTLTKPRQGGPFTAVLLVTGSGPQDRDETLFAHKPFLVLADHLTRHGYAVLRLDDRGTGKSTGDFAKSGLEEFTTDALAAIKWLKARPDVRTAGIFGHSEGGAVGPLAAVRSTDVAFVIMLAGPAQPFDELMLEQNAGIMRAGGAPDQMIEYTTKQNREVFDIITHEPDDTKAREKLAVWMKDKPMLAAQKPSPFDRLFTPELRSLFAYPAAATLSKLNVPTLALYGSKDLQVPADANIKAAAAAFAAGKLESFTITKIPGANHLFQTAKTGSPSEYGNIEETMNPKVLDVITTWLNQTTKN